MFVYRYQRLSSACPDIGTAWVHNLSRACPKIEHLDPTPLIWVMRWTIQKVIPMAELFNAPMVGAFGTYFGERHHIIAIDIKFFLKKIDVPKLEKGHIQAYM